ncbi:MAG: glycosyltransferase [Nitrospirae bacterium]|nr:glycosyltransferase [Nitrospirota bacterium]
MEGLSIIIPVFNKIETTRKCIDSIRGQNEGEAYEIIIVDNGSTDETEQVCRGGFKTRPYHEQITCIRNPENLGVSKALNIGAGAARYNMLCFMHNDVFVLQKNWTAAIYKFINETKNAGVVGLYGAKTMRRDGSFRGKSIVHAKKDSPSIRKPFERVAVVDGLLMAAHKQAFEKMRGFCDGFIMHFYDKDFSMRAYRDGLSNYVLNIPFEHAASTTRSQLVQDDAIRDEAQENFMQVWNIYLPVDVSTWQDRVSYAVKRK